MKNALASRMGEGRAAGGETPSASSSRAREGHDFLEHAGIKQAASFMRKFAEQGFVANEDFSLLFDESMLSDEDLRSKIGMKDIDIRKLRAAAKVAAVLEGGTTL